VTLRTAGLIAGVLGLILLAAGLIAQAVKPANQATPSAAVDTPVVVVPPQVLALSPDGVLTITSDGALEAHTARTQDVDAWSRLRASVTITGVTDWDTLAVSTHDGAITQTPSPSPSASASASASASTQATASATPAPSASPSPSATTEPSAALVSTQDIWRDTAQNDGTYTVDAADVPVGLTLVVEGVGGATISEASLAMPRTIDDDWISQVIWWGAGLSIIGLIALIALFIDVRPAQTKGEEWLAYRAGVGSGKSEPKPGSRRARRAEGTAMPVAVLPDEPITGSVPVVESAPETSEVAMIPVAGRSAPANPEAYEPPAPQAGEDEEDRS
jgi:hypothetical protein